ncbi:Hypothetical predicted protein [Paramuricea clavata]|uniref:Uncharacterized protein n=1 Tax=Paramuricea clavata TaxID=317549 RepID=A0A6S7H0S6_PARCT|nr:Hypothetical predicted protein [Paramuricea clavata]
MYKSSFQSSRLADRRYKQMLEDEQKCLARNKKLLEDIDRLEEQMTYFSNECKQDEEKLNQAKNKFMQYVKSVYPKWTEDVKKWQELKQRSPKDVEQKLHSTPYRNHHSFTEFERSPSHSVPDSKKNYGGSLEYPRDRMGNSRDNVGFGRADIGHHMDMNGSYMGRTGYPKGTTGHSRDMMGYSNDRMGSSTGRMACSRDINPRSFRETTQLSWDEMGFSRGYPRNDIGYPRMYNGGPWMYPQNTPLDMFPHSAHPYFAPVPYGVPRWSTPGYDHWSNPHGRSHENNGTDERQGFSGDDKERPHNVSFERDERGQREGMPSEVLPNTRNGKLYPDERNECYPDERNERYANQRPRDINSFHKEDFTDRHSAENVLDRYPADYLNRPPSDATRQYHHPGQTLGRSNQEADRQKNKRGDENYERDIDPRTLPQRRLEQETENYGPSFRGQGRSQELFNDSGPRFRPQERSQELFNDRERSQRNDRKAMDDDDQRDIQQKHDGLFKEEQTDRTRISAMKVNKPDGHEYLGEPIRDTRLMQLRSEGSGYCSREAMNTDSISLPTIHQYEGDPRDIFSDISDSEPLNEDSRGVSKQSKVQNNISCSDALKQDDTSRIHSQGSKAKDYSDISKNQSPSQDGSSRVKGKHSEGKDPQEFKPKVSKGKKVESSVPGNDRGLLKREVSESKSSVVEDLIGDDLSDFEVSEREFSDDDLERKEPLSENLISENVKRKSEGLTRHKIGDISEGVVDVTGVKDRRKNQGGLINENMAKSKEVAQSDISFENMAGDREKSGHPNESMSQHKEARESVPPTEKGSKELSEILDRARGTDSSKEDVLQQNNDDDKNFSHEGGMSHSSDESIPEELAKTDSDNTSSKRMTDTKVSESKVKADAANIEGLKVGSIQDEKHDAKNTGEAKGDSFNGGGNLNEHQELTKTKSVINTEKDLEEDSRSESREAALSVEGNKGKPGESVDKESDGEIVSEDEKSKSGVLEEVSFSSVESSSESVPVQEKSTSKRSKSKTKESMSYSEDFEDEKSIKSIPLTQSAAYQKMLSTVDVSDEGDDLEADFLEGTMSEANTTAQSTHNMPQTLQDSGTTSQINLPAKPSKSKPTLSLFSSSEKDDFGNSFGNEGVGVLAPSWKSSEGTLSPPLSPDTGDYVPTVSGKVEDKQEVGKGEKEVLPVDENKDEKVETGKKLQESDTKARIQAGFWNNSDSESEVDLQISHGGNDNNDDDDFDFYS